jgi:predicted amidohydrolase
MSKFKVASVQFNPILNERDHNIENLLLAVTEAAKNKAKLIVTPEMATTGYYYKDREAIKEFVDTIPGVTTEKFALVAKEYDTYIVIGMPEVDPETDLYYNAAALIGPEGYIGKFRKLHQWEAEEHWSVWGDLGIPVFETKIGKIAINICMDSIYFESARIPTINGADILIFPTNSTAQSIAVLQARAETNGLYVISANRTNTENGYHMIGASAVWSPDGEKLAEADYLATPEEDIDEYTIIYAQIDPLKYNNKAKQRLVERRTELYKELMLYIAPWDTAKNRNPKAITAATIQYEPIIGDKQANLYKISKLIAEAHEQAKQQSAELDLIVLPELSVIGPVDQLSREEIQCLAESINGTIVEEFQKIAIDYQLHIIFGFIEQDNEQLYNAAVLVTPEGEIEGKYRKTHLSQSEQHWALAGDKVSVFSSEKLGKIGIMIGYDAAFPEVAAVMAIKRADIIAIPSCWKGEFGREIAFNKRISMYKYPPGSMSAWDAIASSAQAYTLIANYVGTKNNYLGRSAMYTLDPYYGLDQPQVASSDKEEALLVHFSTLATDWWFNQEKLILSRRTFAYKTLIY